MLKKILLITSLLLIIVAGVFFQCQNINYNISLNKINNENKIILKQYQAINTELKRINDDIKDINNKKVAVQAKIVNKQKDLKETNNKINEIQQNSEMSAKYNIRNNIGTKWAYFTFDDGPTGYTSKVLDILKEYGIKATFFVNGKVDEYSKNIYRRIVNEGHTIGNHSFSHYFSDIYSSVGSFDYNFNKLQDLIKNETGVEMSIMRFPGGSNNLISNKYVPGIMDTLTVKYKNLGYNYFDWNVSAGNTATPEASNNQVYNNIINGCKKTSYAIILIHDSHKSASDTIENVIISLANSGFKFSNLKSSSSSIRFK